MSESIPKQWAEQARYDLETARAMLESGRYIYVLFCCQQAVEKALKGVIAQNTGEMPPRIHNLVELAKRANLQASPTQVELMRELARYYIETRYPDEVMGLAHSITHDKADHVQRETEKLLKWVLSMLP
ncbi:MAG: HEPN domain-containing protein [Candidatus Hydrogenedentota bacterium]